jgi:hypothetical protein
VFANRSKEEEIFPLATPEIAEAQKADVKLKHCFRHNAVLDKGLEFSLVDDTYVVCKDGKMMQGWQNDNSKATPKACSVKVSPLPAAPRSHST